MAERKTTKKGATAKPGFTAEEKAAMKERARELKANASRAEGERDVETKIAEMPKADRVLAKRVHELVAEHAPTLAPRTWYGMPAYANDEGKVVCFFQSAAKFGSRYATLGFSDRAQLDRGAMWPTVYALASLGAAEEKAIAALLRRAVG